MAEMAVCASKGAGRGHCPPSPDSISRVVPDNPDGVRDQALAPNPGDQPTLLPPQACSLQLADLCGAVWGQLLWRRPRLPTSMTQRRTGPQPQSGLSRVRQLWGWGGRKKRASVSRRSHWLSRWDVSSTSWQVQGVPGEQQEAAVVLPPPGHIPTIPQCCGGCYWGAWVSWEVRRCYFWGHRGSVSQ